MVDAIAPSPDEPSDIEILPWPEALPRYSEFCGVALHAPHQSPHWLDAWQKATGAEMVVAFIRGSFALPLEIVRSGFVRTARLPGSTHANGNFAPFIADRPTKIHAAELAAALRRLSPAIDVLSLERMETQLAGTANPLAALRTGASPNLALATDLSGGFEAVLSRHSGKRKRKKHRSQLRRFEEAGGWRRIPASTPDEIARHVAAYQQMKAAQFARMGVSDPFAGPQMGAFLRDAYSGGQGATRFVLHGLEVGGRLRAVSGSSITAASVTCDFCAFAEDELVQASPGDFLFFENIAEACADGHAVYDFSVGDQPYKRQWCDLERTQFDIFLPVSLKGEVAARLMAARGAIKRRVKESPLLWRTTQAIRRLTGRAAAPGAQPADAED